MGKKTQVYEYHKKHGNIVEYAGFDVPVWFDKITSECYCVRNRVGIFDVSHMGRVLAEGRDALAFLNKITTNDVSSLTVGRGHYSLICNPEGGIIDDLTVFRLPPALFLVVYNAANRSKDWEWLQKNKDAYSLDLSDVSDDMAMFAVQGPRAANVLKSSSGVRLEEIERYGTRNLTIEDTSCLVTRSGYTGEDGFEIYVWNASIEHPANAIKIWNSLLAVGKEFGIRPAGLGARDVLRLEAGMCLYGNDIDEKTSPVEARLNWVVGLEKGDFVGRDAIRLLKETGPSRVRVGFKMLEKGIPRSGHEILDDSGYVGRVTSGTFSPTLGLGIGMGMVSPRLAHLGNRFRVRIRERGVLAEVVRLPFYQRRSEDKVVVFGGEMSLKNFKHKFTTYGQP